MCAYIHSPARLACLATLRLPESAPAQGNSEAKQRAGGLGFQYILAVESGQKVQTKVQTRIVRVGARLQRASIYSSTTYSFTTL